MFDLSDLITAADNSMQCEGILTMADQYATCSIGRLGCMYSLYNKAQNRMRKAPDSLKPTSLTGIEKVVNATIHIINCNKTTQPSIS